MAIQTPTIAADDDGCEVARWGPIASGDTSLPFKCSRWSDMTLQSWGTFGGATLVIQGTNAEVNENQWVTLNDVAGTAMSFTAGSMNVLREAPRFLRWLLTGGGASTAITVVANGAARN